MIKKKLSKIGSIFLYAIDKFVPKDDSLYLFAIGKNHYFSGNLKAFYNYCSSKGKNTKVFSYKKDSTHIYVRTFQAVWLLLRAGVIVVQYKHRDFYWGGITNRKRIIINLWHSTTIKGFYFTNPTKLKNEKKVIRESKNTDFVISSTRIDKLAMAASFYMPFEKVKNTGLPRNDILVQDSASLAPDLQVQNMEMQKLKAGKRLILYAPTFRDGGDGIFDFTQQQIETLTELLRLNDYVFAIRAHPGKNRIGGKSNIIYIDSQSIPETQMVLKNTDILISDYSGIWVDFLLLNKPLIGFFYDIREYEKSSAPLLYDLSHMFPGEIAYSFAELVDCVKDAFGLFSSDTVSQRQRVNKNIFAIYNSSFSFRVLKEIEDIQRNK